MKSTPSHSAWGDRHGPAQRARTPDQLRIVVPRYGADILGGAETAMRRLAHALQDRGWGVEVWTTTALDEATWRAGHPAGISLDGPILVRRYPVVCGRQRRQFALLSRLAFSAPRGLRSESLWAVAQGPYAPDLVRALSVAPSRPTLFSPYLYHPILRGLPAASHPRILCPAAHDEPPLRLRMVGRAVEAADALWFHSPEERELLLHRQPRAAGTPWRCGVVGVDVPLGLDAHAFTRRHGITTPYVYFGGRTTKGKGFDLLLTAMDIAHRRDPGLTVVVSGEIAPRTMRPWLRNVGLLDEQRRWEAIAGAAVILVPGAMESLSLLALEGWAVGRPCLLNGLSPVLRGHLTRGGGGVAFTGAEDLAAKTHDLLSDAGLRDALGRAGQAYVSSTYGWNLAEQRLRELIGSRS